MDRRNAKIRGKLTRDQADTLMVFRWNNAGSITKTIERALEKKEYLYYIDKYALEEKERTIYLEPEIYEKVMKAAQKENVRGMDIIIAIAEAENGMC